MENKDTNNKNKVEAINSEDEQYWEHFEKELWTFIKSRKAALPNKVEKCLAFARCREIAAATDNVSDFERQHLSKCHYCESIVQEFIELNEVVKGTITPPIPPKRSFIRIFIQKLAGFFPPQPELAFAAFGLLCAVLFLGWMIFMNIRQTSLSDSDVAAVSEKESRTEIFTDNANQTATPENTNQISNSENSLNIFTPRPTSPDSNVGANTQKPETPDKPKGIAATDLEKEVNAALNNKGETIPPSKLVQLFLMEMVPRGGETEIEKPKPLSPVKDTVTESKPILKWRGTENAEYVVTVIKQNGVGHEESGTIKQTSWQITKPLESGMYFWIVTAKKPDSKKINKSSTAVFNVILGQEKKNLEIVEKNVKSRLAKAEIYYNRLLFDEAERELQAELKKKPKSRLAKSRLQQVRETKQKIEDLKNQP